jgi:N,N'-diacetyllegionaminate synthase
MKKKCFKFIAELCQNHLGKTYLVERMLDRCVENGSDIIKLQYIYAKNLSFRPRFENGIKYKSKTISIKRPYNNEFSRIKKLELPEKTFEKFVKLCNKYKVTPMITCFARENIQNIINHGFKYIKVASYDCASFQLLRDLSLKFKNIIVSTGATFDDEIEVASKILKKNNVNYSFLHCVTIYPTPINIINLSRINFLKKFSVKSGFSDHTIGTDNNKNLASLLAIFYNADYIERHVRVTDYEETKDGKISILPEDIMELIAFSKLSKKDQKYFLKEKYKVNPKLFLGSSKRVLGDIELQNRDYYRGRFVSKSAKRDIYNWEELPL